MKFSSLTYQPIIFFHTHDVTFSQYLALLTVADCFIVTSLREGMALRTHEFVECQEERKRPLILSEFTGSFSFSGFRECLAINPWDIQMTANAILTSLTMPVEEAARRWKELHAHVNAQTAQAFTRAFLNRTVRVNYKHHIKDSLVIRPLDAKAIREHYRQASQGGGRRLILMDLERTLWPHDTSPPPQTTEVPEEAIKLLERLVADERNEVWGLSGLPVKGKLDKLASRIPLLGIWFVCSSKRTLRLLMIRTQRRAWMLYEAQR
jgi:trehalose 6-phosphate synthase/phosphatase